MGLFDIFKKKNSTENDKPKEQNDEKFKKILELNNATYKKLSFTLKDVCFNIKLLSVYEEQKENSYDFFAKSNLSTFRINTISDERQIFDIITAKTKYYSEKGIRFEEYSSSNSKYYNVDNKGHSNNRI